MHPLGLIFQILLLIAIVAGVFVSWDPRSGKDRRGAGRGGRREADGAAATMEEEPAPH